MPFGARPVLRAARLQSIARQTQVPSVHRAFASGGPLPGGTLGEASNPEQKAPIGPYYEAILTTPQPIPEAKPEDPPTSSPKSPARSTAKKAAAKKSAAASEEKSAPALSATNPSAPAPSPPELSAAPANAQEKARIIFGSALAGPMKRAERLEALRKKSKLVGGVLVPPRPEEPDNCCMSGCVNCVWDRYRDEMEEWVSASKRADEALRAEGSASPRASSSEDGVNAMSMDDDGGGSETNWSMDELKKAAQRPKIAKDLWDDDLYKNVPVGIREFMKQEKRLKEKHAKEGTFGA
ncbi:oxidoreductase-like protein [Xylariaceae sp. FL0016]|nr:oxidoreductase-like protein [Xylariaceae sp. FL0016]